MISDDEYLERLVAGIQEVSTEGAEVRWNEELNGRQFDVVVRFRMGTLRYLVLIEVKNRTRKASSQDLDAFVTKARDQNANKAVFVTVAGFQSGAIEVAKRHGVELFTLTFNEEDIRLPNNATWISIRNPRAPKDVKPEFSLGEPLLVANIEQITLVNVDGSESELPSEQSQMNYYCLKTRLTDGRTLDSVIKTMPIPDVQLGETKTGEHRFTSNVRIFPPDEYFFRGGDVQAIRFKVTGRNGRPMRGNVRIDPNVLTSPAIYTNAITGEKTSFALEALPLGFERVSPGKFYFTVHPLAYFYCDAIKGDLVQWVLVETFQSGEIMQSKTTQEIKYSRHYIPVSDIKIINRLQARLDDYRRK
jgi:hypothetical protein